VEVTRRSGILLVSLVEKCLTSTPSKPGALIIESSDFSKSVALSQISLSISFAQQLNSAIVNCINLSNSVNTPWQLQIFKANLSALLTGERRTKHQQTSRI
jgi:hypothetical protein